MDKFHPRINSNGRGHIAVIENDTTGDMHEIWPLGREKDKEFYSLAAAEQLAERHAETASRLGIGAILNAHPHG